MGWQLAWSQGTAGIGVENRMVVRLWFWRSAFGVGESSEILVPVADWPQAVDMLVTALFFRLH